MKLQSNRLPPVTTPNVGGTLRVPAPHMECAGYIVRGRRTARCGFTLLEFVVALLLFGIAMSGLFPLVVMYSRVLELLEQRPTKLSFHRTNDATYGDNNEYRITNFTTKWYKVGTAPNTTPNTEPNFGEWVHKWYLVPSSDGASQASNAWARKLGASASVRFAVPTNRTEEPLAEPTKADITVVDDGAAAYVAGDWVLDASGGFQGNRHRHAHSAAPPPTSDEKATWTFPQVASGWYQVQATWTPLGDQATDVSYTLYDNGTSLAATFPVASQNQQVAPTLNDGGVLWQPLKIAYFPSGFVSVTLSAVSATNSTAYVNADGMRLVRCSVQITSLTPPTTETATASVEIRPAVRSPP